MGWGSIYSLDDLLSFQKKSLLLLTNKKKFKKLEVFFTAKKTLKRFTLFYNYVFKKITRLIAKKIKNKSGLNFKLSFNLTNDAGVVIFEYDSYLLFKYGNFCMKNTHLVPLFNKILTGAKFNNDVQNQLVSTVNGHKKNSHKFYDVVSNGVSYFSTHTNSTSGGSSEIVYSHIQQGQCGECPSGSTICNGFGLYDSMGMPIFCLTVCTGSTGICDQIYIYQ